MTQDGPFDPKKSSFSLRRRVEKGGAVLIAGFGFRQFLRLGSNLILTRLLMPEVFGLMAAAISVNVLAVMLTDIGLSSSIIRSHNSHDPEFLRTAWTMKIIRNFIIWGVIALLAAGVYTLARIGAVPVESTFADPRLPWIMVLTGVQLLIGAFGSVNKVIADRQLNVARSVGFEVVAQIVATIVTVGAAFSGFGVWSFVMGILASAAYSSIFTHILFPGPRMGLRLVREHVLEIFNFGKWIILASFFGFMTNKGDQMIFGWAMESEQFGLYAVSSIWINAGFLFLGTITRRLFYPAFSELLRDRPENLAQAYKKGRLVIDAGAALIVVSALLFSDPILKMIYPETFSGVPFYLKLQLPVILLLPYRLLNYAILSSGASKQFTLITFMTGITALFATPAVIWAWDIKAGVIFFSCATIASLPSAWRIAGKIMPIDWRVESRLLILCAILVALLIGMEPG